MLRRCLIVSVTAVLTAGLLGPAPARAAETAPAAEAVTVANIKKFLLDTSHPPMTIDGMISVLPPSYRTSYALVYDSKSLQQASAADPRVILFNADETAETAQPTSLLIAFNAEGNERGAQTLEFAEFDRATAAFTYYEATFPKPGDAAGTIQFSAPNPPVCLGCHRADPRPNWEPYDVWPGTYGTTRFGGPIDGFDEAGGLARFAQTARSRARYRWLALPGSVDHMAVTNAVLNERLATLNYLRVARELRAMPGYATYKFAVLAASSVRCHVDIRDFLPASVNQAMRASLAAYTADSNRVVARLSEQERKTIGSSGVESLFEVGNVAAMRYLIEGRGLSMSDWSMSFQPGSYLFASTTYYGMSGLGAAMVASDPELATYGPVSPSGIAPAQCQALKAASRAAFDRQGIR